mmetsp:Transcript_127274/g.360185  ORF Transcript_127274/g.360185 Transcript_127274/m.360185 type:complete len:113 (+) Transcript_127274:76-414(+)
MSDLKDACQLITVKKFCTEQAAALQQCVKLNGGADREDCRGEQHRFVSCATEAMPGVIGVLTDVASQRCRTEVQAFQQCVKGRGGGTSAEEACEALDQAALECAGRAILGRP